MEQELTGQQAETTNAGATSAAQQTGTATSADSGAPAPGQQGSPVSAADLHAQSPAAAAAANGQAPAAGQNPAAAATDAAADAAAATTAATPQTWDSARAYAASLGLQGATQFQDDQQFIQALATQAQQAQAYQQQLQFLSQQMAGLMAAQRQQAAPPAPAAAPEKPKLWNPPEYQPQWETLVRKDEQGNLQVVPGAPPDLLPKYLAYHNYRKDFANKLLENPVETLNPFIEERAKSIADEAVNKHLKTYQDQVYTDNFISQNSAWLHQRDPQGNVLTNPATGRPVLTPEGARFQEHVLYAERQLGVSDIRKQESYARSMLQRDLALARLQPQQAAQQGAAAAQQVIQQGNRAPNRSGSLFNPGNPGAQPAQNPNLSLRDQLAQSLAAAGYSLDQSV
jgi:hypothetical protein